MGGGVFDHLSSAAVKWLDTISLGAVLATLLGWLPHLAAGLSGVWVCLRISNEILDRRIKKQELAINQRTLGNE